MISQNWRLKFLAPFNIYLNIFMFLCFSWNFLSLAGSFEEEKQYASKLSELQDWELLGTSQESGQSYFTFEGGELKSGMRYKYVTTTPSEIYKLVATKGLPVIYNGMVIGWPAYETKKANQLAKKTGWSLVHIDESVFGLEYHFEGKSDRAGTKLNYSTDNPSEIFDLIKKRGIPQIYSMTTIGWPDYERRMAKKLEMKARWSLVKTQESPFGPKFTFQSASKQKKKGLTYSTSNPSEIFKLCQRRGVPQIYSMMNIGWPDYERRMAQKLVNKLGWTLISTKETSFGPSFYFRDFLKNGKDGEVYQTMNPSQVNELLVIRGIPLVVGIHDLNWPEYERKLIQDLADIANWKIEKIVENKQGPEFHIQGVNHNGESGVMHVLSNPSEIYNLIDERGIPVIYNRFRVGWPGYERQIAIDLAKFANWDFERKEKKPAGILYYFKNKSTGTQEGFSYSTSDPRSVLEMARDRGIPILVDNDVLRWPDDTQDSCQKNVDGFM